MKYPNFNEERKLKRRGYEQVVGLDESGRGPLAGPVVAGAVYVRKNLKPNTYTLIPNLRDSKKLTLRQREEIYEILKACTDIKWGIGKVSEKVIDRINILEATKLAMKRAIRNLEKKHSLADFLIIDGNFGISLDIAQKSIIKADEKVISCALASIIAKVSRDRMMINYHRKYPQYSFDKHKGYPTKLHRKMLKKHGFCKIHRKSFTFTICPVVKL